MTDRPGASSPNPAFEPLEELFDEMIAQQKARLVALARNLDSSLSGDDLLSPYDFPAIAHDPRFNFEDGLLAGLISARTAIRARIIVPGLSPDSGRGGEEVA